jgi:hypothetical protein
MLLSGGSLVVPEVQLVDLGGVSHQLTYVGFLGTDDRGGVSFCLNTDGGVYKKVRIRSNLPFRCSTITWWGQLRA